MGIIHVYIQNFHIGFKEFKKWQVFTTVYLRLQEASYNKAAATAAPAKTGPGPQSPLNLPLRW